MKILVTGTDGFIGSQLAGYLVSIGHQVEGWEYIPNKYPDPAQCDRVIHCGAISSTTEKDVEKVMQQNTDFTLKLIELCDMMGTSMQYSSTANLYGNTNDFNEDADLHPESPYAWSKYLVDRFVKSYSKDFRINIQGFRYFNVFGNGEDHKGDQMSPVSKFTKQAKANQNIKLFENSENYKRDFVSVEDVCKVHAKMLDVDKSGIFNVGTGEATSFKTIADKVADKYGVNVDLIPMPKDIAKNYQEYTCADNTKLQESLNYEFENVIDWIDRQ
tara:strand:- start:1889 stop:2707 length:819 start_codon:yes stop_codon:yes gene_type:complete